MSIFVSRFRASSLSFTSGKNIMVIHSSVFEIFGSTLSDAIMHMALISYMRFIFALHLFLGQQAWCVGEGWHVDGRPDCGWWI